MPNATNITLSTELSSPFVGQPINSAARVIFSALGSIMIVCGVTGSALLITVLFRRFRRNRHVHDLFLANLSVSDLMMLGYWLSFMVLDLILGFHPVVNQAHCVVNGMVVCTLSMVCLLSLLAISLNRYLHVCHSQLCRRFFTMPRTVLTIVCIWVVGILVALPPALKIDKGVYQYNPHNRICSFNRETFSYAKSMVIFSCTVPMTVIGFCNFSIFRFWRKTKANLEGWKDDGGLGRVFTRGEECVESSRETAATTDQAAEARQCEGGQGNSVPDSEEAAAGIWSKTASDVPSTRQASHTETFDSHACRPDNDIENLSRSLDNKRKVQTRGCAEQALSYPAEELVIQIIEDEQDPEEDKCSQERPMLRNASDSCGILFSTTRTASTKNIVAAIPIQENPVRKNTLSCSSLASTGIKCSRQNQQKSVSSSATHNVQQRNKKNNKEVAFVRSLFIVWLFTVISFIPYAIIMVISSVLPVPSEVVTLGLLLLFANNSVNWIVYGVMHPSFRREYKRCGQQLLGVCCQRRQEPTDSHQMSTSGTPGSAESESRG